LTPARIQRKPRDGLTDYRAAQKEMREIVTAKGNIDHLLGATGGRADKEQAR